MAFKSIVTSYLVKPNRGFAFPWKITRVLCKKKIGNISLQIKLMRSLVDTFKSINV